MASKERFIRCRLEFDSGAINAETPLDLFYEVEETVAILHNRIRIDNNLYVITEVNAPK